MKYINLFDAFKKSNFTYIKQILTMPTIYSIIFIKEKEDVNLKNPDRHSTIAQTNSEIDSTSEFQECLDRAEDLSRRIRALSPKSEINEKTNEISKVDSNQRLSRRQSVMIRRIFEKYSDIIGKFEQTMSIFYLPDFKITYFHGL